MKVLTTKITMFNYALVSKNGQVETISSPERMTTEEKEAHKAAGCKVVSLSTTKNTYQMPIVQFIEQATLVIDDNSKDDTNKDDTDKEEN